MPVSTTLPCTANLDRDILKYFRKVCSLKDTLHDLQRKEQAVLGTNRLEQEGVANPQYTLLHADISEKSKILGYYLGKRLHAKYSQVVSSKLQGQDGYAILDLVPCSSPAWKTEQKETLLGWFLEEIQPHLESVEAIKPTFSQVNMRKVKDTLMGDEKNAPPLTYSFLKART